MKNYYLILMENFIGIGYLVLFLLGFFTDNLNFYHIGGIGVLIFMFIMIKVLVVDDSAFMRRLFSNTINNDPQLNVVGTARNGQKAIDKIDKLNPDVITLDVEMPIKNGIETLSEIVNFSKKIPVIMVSALDNRDTVLKALDLGAIDFIPKPSGSISLNIDDIKERLIKKIKVAAKCSSKPCQEKTKVKAKHISSKPIITSNKDRSSYPVIAIGCSSGGPKTLKQLISAFPKDFPAAIVIVQHMPAGFTTSLASRLDQKSEIDVKEAEEKDQLKPGLALLAPGDYHLEVSRNNGIMLNQKPKKWGVRPCVDHMMNSVAKIYQERTIGLILTGMGHDGAEGMKEIKKQNGYGIVEDKSTALVYGMPSATINKKAYNEILPLDQIPSTLIEIIERRYQ
jgi:two-component system chemotaxis response regulator CheB